MNHRTMVWKTLIIILCIIACTSFIVLAGFSITGYVEMKTTGVSHRAELADDMGLGMLLLLGLVVEIPAGVITGLITGLWISRKIRAPRTRCK